MSMSIREWFPKIETFKLVYNCFSIVKSLQRSVTTRFVNTRDTWSEDVVGTSDLEEHEEEMHIQSIHESKNESWLKSKLFPTCRRKENDNLSSGGTKLHIMHVSF